MLPEASQKSARTVGSRYWLHLSQRERACTTLHASIPDVERLSQAIHLDETTPEGFCSLALRNVFETVVCYDSAEEDRNLHLSR